MNLSWNGYRRFVVFQKVSECNGVVSLYLKPEDGRKLPPFKPGQYLTFKLNIPREEEPVVRFYSISDRPREDYYRITVKKECPDGVPPGLASCYICDVLKQGAILDVGAPSGQFFLDSSREDPVMLISGGVGITPVLSMLNSLTAVGAHREVWFVHGAGNGSEHIQKEQLEQIARENPDVRVHVFYSRPEPQDTRIIEASKNGPNNQGTVKYHSSRVKTESLKDLLASSGRALSGYDFFICGGPKFMNDIIEGLKTGGVPEEKIHWEAFGPETVDKMASSPVLVPWKVIFAKSAQERTWDGASKNLLSFAREQGCKIPYICRAGTCRTCKVKIISGEVQYLRDPKPEKGEKFWQEGFCLTCICRPKSDLVLDIGTAAASAEVSARSSVSPFEPKTKDQIDRILCIPPFSQMPEIFRQGELPKILSQHARIRTFARHEIIVRKGDFGTSAFLIMDGEVRVVLDPDLPAAVLGRAERRRNNLFRIVPQLWAGFREPESFSDSELRQDIAVKARRGSGDEVRVVLEDLPAILSKYKNETVIRRQGEWFGEMAALTRAPRSATVLAETDKTELLEVRWQGLRDLMEQDDKLRIHIDQIYRDRARETARREVPLLRNLENEALEKVIQQTEFLTYGDYDWSLDYKELAAGNKRDQEQMIAAEGDYPNGVFFIRAGFARVSQKFGNGHRTLNYLGAGRFYGLQEVAHNWRKPDQFLPLQYTLRVTGYTHIIFIPTHVMEDWVLRAIPKKDLPPLMTLANASGAPPPAIDASARIGLETFEFLTENRFFNGTGTMLIDLDRCTRCDDCVRACAATHDNNPRFLRQGPTSGRLMVANACMHCVDPVCMIGCPTGAIHRDQFGGEVVINPITCIGCTVCANNCPYDAIRMVEIRNPDGSLREKNAERTLKATKCDLCIEQIGGPACQRACPHGALSRVNLSDLNAFAAWLKR